jgi:hypothetical protein
VRERALWNFYGNIFHQGTCYQATAYAVPFLLEMLADKDTPDQKLMELLGSIAVGYDEQWLPNTMQIDECRELAQRGPAEEGQICPRHRCSLRCRQSRNSALPKPAK